MSAAPARTVAPVSAVRSTWIAASVTSLRKAGLFERYEKALPPGAYERIALCVAGSWMPIEEAIMHYGACESLGLAPDEVRARGEEVSLSIQRSLLDVVSKTARGAGVTPWTVIGFYPRIWAKVYQGGEIETISAGPKEVVIRVHQMPLARFRYFRSGMGGVLLNINSKFCRRGYIHELPSPNPTVRLEYKYQWA
jgi:hypothetical protein